MKVNINPSTKLGTTTLQSMTGVHKDKIRDMALAGMFPYTKTSDTGHFRVEARYIDAIREGAKQFSKERVSSEFAKRVFELEATVEDLQSRMNELMDLVTSGEGTPEG